MKFHETDKLALQHKLSRQVTNSRFDMPQGADSGYAYITATISQTFDAEHKDLRVETYTSVHLIERKNFVAMFSGATHLALDQATRKFLAMENLYVSVTDDNSPVKENAQEIKEEVETKSEKKTTKKTAKKTTKKADKKESKDLLKECGSKPETLADPIEEGTPLDEEDPLADTPAPNINEKYDRNNNAHKTVLGGIIDKYYPTWRQSSELKKAVKEKLLPSIVDKLAIFETEDQREAQIACEEFVSTVKKILG